MDGGYNNKRLVVLSTPATVSWLNMHKERREILESAIYERVL